MKVLVQKESAGEWYVWSPKSSNGAHIIASREYNAFNGKFRIFGYFIQVADGAGIPKRIGFEENFQAARAIANKYVKEGAQ